MVCAGLTPVGGCDSPRLAREAWTDNGQYVQVMWEKGQSLHARVALYPCFLCMGLTRPSMSLASEETHRCQLMLITIHWPLCRPQEWICVAPGALRAISYCTLVIPRIYRDLILSWPPGIHSGLNTGYGEKPELSLLSPGFLFCRAFLCVAWGRKGNCFLRAQGQPGPWPPRQGPACFGAIWRSPSAV